MSDKEKLQNALFGILIESGAYTDEIKQRFIVAMDSYDIAARITEIVPTDEHSNTNLIKQFALSKAVAGYSEKTIKQYLRAINHFTNKVQKNLLEVTANDIRAYLAYKMTVDGLRGRGIENLRWYISAFYQWAENSDLIQRNPVRQVEKVRLPKQNKEAFSDLDCEKLRGACLTLKEKAVIELLFSTACRVSELTSIRTEDIDGNRIIVKGKGNKYAPVYLDSRAKYIVNAYIASRTDSNPFLIAGRSENKPMSTRAVEALVKRVADRGGVADAYPHRFRRTTATQARRRGMGLDMVSKMLRHENVQTTMRYIDITDADLSHQHAQYVV